MSDQQIEFPTHPVAQKAKDWDALLEAHQAGTFGKTWAQQHAPQSEESNAVHEFSSTQVDMPKSIALAVEKFQQKIPTEALNGEYGTAYGGDSASSGREMEPHCTCLYGLHTADPEEVRKALAGEAPVKLTLGETALFKGDDGDVLIVEVDSPDLHRLNKKLRALPNSNSYPTYKPHLTIAYLKPGFGADYTGDRSLAGKTAVIDAVIFSGKDGNKAEIKLGGTAKPPLE